MAAKRETSLLENWIDTELPTLTVASPYQPNPVLDLGIDGLIDLELVSASSAAGVYKAVQTALQRTVAIKVLHDEPGSPAARRFDTERRITSQLTGHAGIVPLLAAGTTRGGKPYLMMPYYRRGSMARLLAEHGPLNWREAAFLMESIAVTVSEVHGRGLIHGNLAPSNILLTDFLLPRVSDFASSAVIDTTTAPTAVDVQALGAMLWSLLLGAPNRRAPQNDPEASATVTAPESILDLIGRTMSDDPDRRPASAADFVTELRGAAQNGPETGPVATIGSPRIGRRGPGAEWDAAAQAAGPGASARQRPSAVSPQPDGQAGGPQGPIHVGPSPAGSGTEAGTGTGPASAANADGLAPSAEARYILALVACIAVAVLVMVLAAVLAVS